MIASVYFFLRRVHGMPHDPITKEEFDATYAVLRNMAKRETRTFSRLTLKRLTMRTRAWRRFLAYGHFGMKITPFGNWASQWSEKKDFHPWWGSWNMFTKATITDHPADRVNALYSLPPNFDELVVEVERDICRQPAEKTDD